MKTHGQFCPVAKAAEVLTERWTPLVIRELLSGSSRFNEIRRGVPLMSPSLLSRRLKDLEEAGVVECRREPNGQATSYSLTPAGEELKPLIEVLGVWGQRWVRSEVTENDLDAGLLMWDMHRNIDTAILPRRRTTIAFEFLDVKGGKRHWWLVAANGEVDLCLRDPGFDVDLYVATGLETMTRVWMGDLTLRSACDAGLVELQGDSEVIRAMPRWLICSAFSKVERPKRDATR